MKIKIKSFLLLLCVTLFFSCQDQKNKYVGLWELRLDSEDIDSYWYLASDGSACNDVHYGDRGVSIIEELENCSCDDSKNLGSWMKIEGQNFMQLTFQGETLNIRIANETANLIELEFMGKTISLQKTNEQAFKKAWLDE
tara:strand:- start:3353 stop:3772 length:420 start_codon:yes stop_codon:yes gene_type:complete